MIDGCRPGRVRDRIAKWRSAFDHDRDRRDKIRPAINVTVSYIAGRGITGYRMCVVVRVCVCVGGGGGCVCCACMYMCLHARASI